MITVVQRVHYARVLVDGECVGSIEKGLLLFVGVETGDGEPELRQGNRPDFTAAAAPELANALYQRVTANLRTAGLNVATGQFGADMNVELSNDGPITLILNIRNGKVTPRTKPVV